MGVNFAKHQQIREIEHKNLEKLRNGETMDTDPNFFIHEVSMLENKVLLCADTDTLRRIIINNKVNTKKIDVQFGMKKQTYEHTNMSDKSTLTIDTNKIYTPSIFANISCICLDRQNTINYNEFIKDEMESEFIKAVRRARYN